MKAAIEAALSQLRKTFLRGLDQRHGHVHILFLPQNRVAKDELKLVFDDGDRYPEFEWGTGLAPGDPARMRLEDRKDFLPVGDFIIAQHSPLDLSALTPCVSYKVFERLRLLLRQLVVSQEYTCLLNTSHQRATELQKRFHCLCVVLLLTPESSPVEMLLDFPDQMPPLTPSIQLEAF